MYHITSGVYTTQMQKTYTNLWHSYTGVQRPSPFYVADPLSLQFSDVAPQISASV